MVKKLITILFLVLAFSIPAFADDIQDATIYYNEAIDLYSNEETDKAIELFEKAVELDPNFYEAHYNLAQILISVNRYEEALKSLEKIAKLKPDDTETLYNIGKIQYKRGYLSKAHSYLAKIPTTAAQYQSAKILIEKIEKRQAELNLETKIKDHKPVFDPQGKAKSIEMTGFSAPSGVTIDKNGNIFVASFTESIIYKISSFGQKTRFNHSGLLKGPIGLVFDKENNLYVANYSANTIVKITPENSASVFASINKPYSITYDETNNRLLVTEQSTNKLVKFDL